MISDARRRWLVFGLGAAAFWLSFFHRMAPAALAADLTTAFAVSGASLGALAATYFYVYAVMQVPTGVLVDTVGPRRILTAGCLLAGIGSLGFAAAATIVGAAAGRTLVGIGVSVAFVALLKLSASWFEERRFATASGFANVIGIAGALTATAPLAWIISFISWRAVFTAAGVASLLLAAAIWLFVRDTPAAGGPAVHRDPPRADERWWHGLSEIVRNRATWPSFWVTFGISGSYMSFIGLWAVPFLVQAYGLTRLEAARHTSVIIVCSACALAAVGLLSDHYRLRRPLIIGSCVLYVACWVLWIIGVPAGWTYAMAAMMGAAGGGFSLAWACAKEVNRPRYAGVAIAVANIGGFLAAGILQPLVGWVLDLTAGGAANAITLADFRPALALLTGFSLIGLAGAWFIRETRCRNIWAGKRTGEAT